MKPGKPARFGYEYVRNGTANVFMFVDAHRPWCHAKVTDRRSCSDFAECMRDLVDTHYPKADRIRVVLDNLSTHTPAVLYETFEPAEARRILRRLEFHFTPKHCQLRTVRLRRPLACEGSRESSGIVCQALVRDC